MFLLCALFYSTYFDISYIMITLGNGLKFVIYSSDIYILAGFKAGHHFHQAVDHSQSAAGLGRQPAIPL